MYGVELYTSICIELVYIVVYASCIIFILVLCIVYILAYVWYTYKSMYGIHSSTCMVYILVYVQCILWYICIVYIQSYVWYTYKYMYCVYTRYFYILWCMHGIS